MSSAGRVVSSAEVGIYYHVDDGHHLQTILLSRLKANKTRPTYSADSAAQCGAVQCGAVQCDTAYVVWVWRGSQVKVKVPPSWSDIAPKTEITCGALPSAGSSKRAGGRLQCRLICW